MALVYTTPPSEIITKVVARILTLFFICLLYSSFFQFFTLQLNYTIFFHFINDYFLLNKNSLRSYRQRLRPLLKNTHIQWIWAQSLIYFLFSSSLTSISATNFSITSSQDSCNNLLRCSIASLLEILLGDLVKTLNL